MSRSKEKKLLGSCEWQAEVRTTYIYVSLLISLLSANERYCLQPNLIFVGQVQDEAQKKKVLFSVSTTIRANQWMPAVPNLFVSKKSSS